MNRFERAYQRLSDNLQGEVRKDVSLAQLTTLQVGGEAKIFAIAESLRDLRHLLDTVAEMELPWFPLGRGSNLLVSDAGFEGIAFRLGRDFRKTKFEKGMVRAGAAVPLPHLAQKAYQHSLGGLGFAVGIPGSVGGALVMNAGAHGSSFGDVIKTVIVCEPPGKLEYLDRGDLRFRDRGSSVSSQGIVVEAVLALRDTDSVRLRYEMERNFVRRKRTQPVGRRSAGCVFKNPAGLFAGKLLDEVGAKGLTSGSAEVSSKHANFIVNTGGASGNDVYSLMKLLQHRVYQERGIVLEPEVTLVGEFPGEPLLSQKSGAADGLPKREVS